MVFKKLALFLLIFLCLALFWGWVTRFERQANARFVQIRAAQPSVVVLPQGELLESREEVVRSHVPRCATVGISQLFGANDLTLQEIAEWYAANIDPTVWEGTGVSEFGITFTRNDGFSLGVSDAHQWRFKWVDIIPQWETKYDTLYFVEIGGFVDPNITQAQCT